MNRNARRPALRLDAWTRVMLTVLAVVGTVLVIELWFSSAPALPRAEAGEIFNNSAGQRDAMLEAQKQTVAKLDELIALLKSGQVKVQMSAEGEKPDADAPAAIQPAPELTPARK